MSQFSTYVITQPCVGVKNAACLEVCPVDCIHTAPGVVGAVGVSGGTGEQDLECCRAAVAAY